MPLVPHGFPDWYRLSGRADEVFMYSTIPDIDGLQTFGPFFVGAHQSLMLRFTATTGNFIIRLRYLDNTGGSELTHQTLFVNQGGKFVGSLPILGPWVTLEVTPIAVNSACDIRLWSAQNAANSMETSGDQNVLLAFSNFNINAGATRTDVLPRVWPGEAQWTVQSVAATFEAILWTKSPSGAFRMIDRMTELHAGARRTVYLPAASIEVATMNTSAANQRFYVSLSARPIWAGA